jgi:hypothetical protein
MGSARAEENQKPGKQEISAQREPDARTWGSSTGAPRFFADRRRAAIESERSYAGPSIRNNCAAVRSSNSNKAKTATFASFLDFEAV